MSGHTKRKSLRTTSPCLISEDCVRFLRCLGGDRTWRCFSNDFQSTQADLEEKTENLSCVVAQPAGTQDPGAARFPGYALRERIIILLAPNDLISSLVPWLKTYIDI